ncbi:MAG: hypothetical protein ACKOA9_11615 [Actinomycetota bacterium]
MGRRRARLTSPRCEVCGAKGAWRLSLQDWGCCDAHVDAPKPDRPVYHFRTGERLAAGAPDPKPYRAEILRLDEMLYPIDHLDFAVDINPGEGIDVDEDPDAHPDDNPDAGTP